MYLIKPTKLLTAQMKIIFLYVELPMIVVKVSTMIPELCKELSNLSNVTIPF